MTNDEFQRLAALYGFAPSRALRELVDAAVAAEREACAKVCDEIVQRDETGYGIAEDCAATRRAIVRAAAEIGRSMK